MAYAGFDFVVVDLEHAPLDLQTAYRLINSAAALGMTHCTSPGQDPVDNQKSSTRAPWLLVPHVERSNKLSRSGKRAVSAHGSAARAAPAGQARGGMRPKRRVPGDRQRRAVHPAVEASRRSRPRRRCSHSPRSTRSSSGRLTCRCQWAQHQTSPEVLDLIRSAIDAAHAAGKRCGWRSAACRRGPRKQCATAATSSCSARHVNAAEAARGLVTTFRDATG